MASMFYVSLFLSVTILAEENAWSYVGVFQIPRPVQPVRAWQNGERIPVQYRQSGRAAG